MKKAIDFPKVFEMELAFGEESVKTMVEFELIQLARKFSTSGNLTDFQAQFVAGELIAMYPKESIADFKACFDGLVKGKYGTVYRIDANVIFETFLKYLEHKYEFIEDRLMKEKEDSYKIDILDVAKVVSNEKAIDYLQQMLDNISKIEEKKPMPLSKDDIKIMGQERWKPSKRPTPPSEFIQMEAAISKVKGKYFSHIKHLHEVETFEYFRFGEHTIFAPDKETATAIFDEAKQIFETL